MKKKEIKTLDSLWALAVKETAKYRCEHCGRYDSRMEAAHVCGRRHRMTRWGALLPVGLGSSPRYDLCGHCLCHVCHQQYDEHGPREPEIVERTVGFERLGKIQALAFMRVAKEQEFEEIKRILEKKRAEADDSPFASTL
jgi:hypothetical protein